MSDILLTISIALAIISLSWLFFYLLIRKLHENEALKYEFITIITHKFRTPLTQIKWSVENLIEEESEPFKKQSLSNISRSNENLIKLTNTLVGLTDSTKVNRSSYNLTRLDLCEIARSVVDTAKTSFHEKNLTISFTTSESQLFVDAERSRMEYVLSTLLENACVYTPVGRRVDVTVTADRRKVAVSVKDDGIGIAAGDLSHVSTKFFRTKQAQNMDTEGFGVGLYLANTIVKRHKGKMFVTSDGLGKGSTFSVVFPRVR